MRESGDEKGAISKQDASQLRRLSIRATGRSMRIPSIRVSTKVLDDLCRLLKTEYDKFDKADKDVEEMLLQVRTKHGETEHVSGLDVFAGNEIPKDVLSVSLSLRGLGKSILVYIDADEFHDDSYYEVRGTDRTWVNGVIFSLSDMFDDYKTHNDFFRSIPTASIIYIPLAILFTYAVYLIALSLLDQELVAVAIVLVVGVPMMASAFGWYYLARWLFPKYELAHMLRVRVRKWILSGIGALLIGIILIYIQALVKLPFISQ